MRRVYHLGIEPQDARYTAQWSTWFPRDLRAAGLEVVDVPGRLPARRRALGRNFLDPSETQVWKATQLAALVEGGVDDGSVVFLADAWSPATIHLAYLRDLTGRRFKIAGVLHAGAWDPWDLLALAGTEPWARPVEEGFVAALDAVFLATHFHADLLRSARRMDPSRTHVTGLPLLAREWAGCARPWAERPRRVVFPHRLAPEKEPQTWEALQAAYRAAYPGDEVEWIATRATERSKRDYLDLLGSSRVAFSAARQETWGIAMLEAQSLGCHPVAPNRLAYPETVGRTAPLYGSLAQAVRLVRFYLDYESPAPYDGAPWEDAIPAIARVLASL